MIPNLPAQTQEPKLSEAQQSGGNSLVEPVQNGGFQKTMQQAQTRLREESEETLEIPSAQIIAELAAPFIALNPEPMLNTKPVLIETVDFPAFEDSGFDTDLLKVVDKKIEIVPILNVDFLPPSKVPLEILPGNTTPMLPGKLELPAVTPTALTPQIQFLEIPNAVTTNTVVNSEIIAQPLRIHTGVEKPLPTGTMHLSLPLESKSTPNQKISFESVAPHVWQALTDTSLNDEWTEEDTQFSSDRSLDSELGKPQKFSLLNAQMGTQDFGSESGTLDRPWDFNTSQQPIKTETQIKMPSQNLDFGNPEIPVKVALPQLSSVLLQQITLRISNWSMAHREELVVQVDPPNLGKVQVELQMHQGQVSARIHVENENVRQLLESQLQTLKQTLEQQGVRLESLQVSVQDRNASLLNPEGQNTESFFQRRGSQSKGGPGMETDADLELNTEEDTGRRWGFNTVEFVG